MNKKFIALAVAGILAAPMAAQAEATIYGKFHVGIDSLTNAAAGATVSSSGAVTTDTTKADISGTHVTSNASRIGVKGSESLGGGLSAIYQMEASVDLAGGGGTLGGRQSYLGLAGGFGAVLAGHLDTPEKGILKDPFADSVADANNILYSPTLKAATGVNVEDLRAGHAVAYATPNFNGLSAVIAYGPDGTKASTVGGAGVNQDAWTGDIAYNNGPIFAAYSYLTMKNASDLASLTGNQAHQNLSVGRLSAAYNLGNGLKIAGAVDWVKVPNVVKRNNWILNADYTMGNNSFMVEYGQAGKNKDWNGATLNDGAKMWGVGVANHMSKATELYAVYGSIDNDAGGAGYVMAEASGVTSAKAATSNGAKSTAFELGLVHKF